ncbi:MAG: hypothetical protein HPY69_04280 [Armatimonadetes bacterium]|nr:hypothetical protein [Armatimonadota bacterium]
MRDIDTIVGLRVLTIEEAVNLGTVSQVVVDLSQGRVLGIMVNTAAGEQAVAADDIQTIGADVVMVSNRQVLKPRADLPELDKFRRPANAAPLQVFTTSGRRLGAVAAVYIDPLEKVVNRYEVSAGPLRDMAEGILVLPVIAGSVHGQDAVIIPDELVAQQGRETGGLLAKLNSLGQKVKEQYQQTAEKVEEAVDKGAEALRKEAAVVKERAGDLTEKAKEQYQQAAEKVEEKVGKGAEVLKKEAAEVKERAEELSEKAKERAQKVAETIKEEAQELGAKAKQVTSEAGQGAAAEQAVAEPAGSVPAEEGAAETEAPGEVPAEPCAEAEEATPDSEVPAEKPAAPKRRTRKESNNA